MARLQQDGRIANVDRADAVGLSPSSSLRRVKALEASGIISGYHAEVSRTRAGLGLTVFIGLKVDGHSRESSSRIERSRSGRSSRMSAKMRRACFSARATR